MWAENFISANCLITCRAIGLLTYSTIMAEVKLIKPGNSFTTRLLFGVAFSIVFAVDYECTQNLPLPHEHTCLVCSDYPVDWSGAVAISQVNVPFYEVFVMISHLLLVEAWPTLCHAADVPYR